LALAAEENGLQVQALLCSWLIISETDCIAVLGKQYSGVVFPKFGLTDRAMDCKEPIAVLGKRYLGVVFPKIGFETSAMDCKEAA
jgi:hypothetical protein